MSLHDEATLAALFPPATGPRPPVEHQLDAYAHACAAVLNARHVIWDTRDEHPVRMTEPSKSPTVAQLMFAEQVYARNDARTRRLATLSKEMTQAELAWVCYQCVYRNSRGVDRNGVYDLLQLAEKEAYHLQVVHSRAEDPNGRKQLRAGGLVDGLYDAVFPVVREWAVGVYKSVVAQVGGAVATVGSPETTALIERITVHITCRAVCKPCGSHVDPLASSVLEQMSARYVEAELVASGDAVAPGDAACALLPADADPRWGVAMQKVQSDASDLHWLVRLVQASTATAVAEVLRLGRVELERIVAAPPPELRAAASWKKCRVTPLTVVVDVAQDLEMRANLAVRWIESNGVFALGACHEALVRMKAWKPMVTPFLETLALWSAPGEFPRLPHTPQRNHYKLARPRGDVRVRTGLSAENECAVRFISVVWDLVGHGEMRHGQLHAGIVCDVSMHCLTESMLVYRLLREQIMKEGLFVGPTLHATTDEIMESDGQFAAEVAKASHAVCRLSIAELFEPLQITDDRAMEIVTVEIGRRLRPLLDMPPNEDEVLELKMTIHEKEVALVRVDGVAPPPGTRQALAGARRSLDRLLCMHPAFVYDAYALAATAVATMRHRMCIPSISPIHPVVSGLMGSPIVRAWTPADGPLVLDEWTIARLPADTRRWLLSIVDERSDGPTKRAGFALCTRRHDKGKRAQIVLTNPYALMRLVVHCALSRSEEEE